MWRTLDERGKSLRNTGGGRKKIVEVPLPGLVRDTVTKSVGSSAPSSQLNK